MIKINFNLLQILTMNSLNVTQQGKKSNQLAFHLSAYTYLWKLWRAIFQKHTKYKMTASKIQSLIIAIKMIWKRKWMAWLGCTMQCKKNWKQYHIQSKSKFLPWYMINGLKCTIENILMSLCTLLKSFEIKNAGGILVKPAPEKMKNYHHWNTSSSNKRFWKWQFQ